MEKIVNEYIEKLKVKFSEVPLLQSKDQLTNLALSTLVYSELEKVYNKLLTELKNEIELKEINFNEKNKLLEQFAEASKSESIKIIRGLI